MCSFLKYRNVVISKLPKYDKSAKMNVVLRDQHMTNSSNHRLDKHIIKSIKPLVKPRHSQVQQTVAAIAVPAESQVQQNPCW